MRCGNTDNYDLARLWAAPEDIRALKLRLLAAVFRLAQGCPDACAQEVIDQALFVLVPGGLGGIVKIAGEHGRNEQDGVDDILCFKGHHGQRDQCDAEYKDEAGTPGLALGEFAVHGKRAAMVVGELIVEH